jgi:hypothetical protein
MKRKTAVFQIFLSLPEKYKFVVCVIDENAF